MFENDHNKMYLMLMIIVLIAPSLQIPTNHAFKGRSNKNAGLDLLILHTNDMHAHFEQTDDSFGECSPEEAAKNKCFGGFARVSSVVKQYRNNAKKDDSAFLFLNAGDSYTGTPWYTIFRHKVVSEFMNILRPDAAVNLSLRFDALHKLKCLTIYGCIAVIGQS